VIDDGAAKVQIKRFSAFGFPPEADGMKELVKALCSAAISGRHAQAIADYWLEHRAKWPCPADIYDAASETAEPFVNQQTADCPLCDGTGFVKRPQRRYGDVPYDFVAMCRCHPGRNGAR
jgi:hypothetical protein